MKSSRALEGFLAVVICLLVVNSIVRRSTPQKQMKFASLKFSEEVTLLNSRIQ